MVSEHQQTINIIFSLFLHFWNTKMNILLTIFTFTAFSVLILFSFLIFKIYSGKSTKDPSYPPVSGTVFHMLFYFDKLYDYQTQSAKTQQTFRLLSFKNSQIYTTDIRNIEHVLKLNFGNYSKGEYNQEIMTDLFGDGIFNVDGEKWRQQRKLASFEFSTRVLRDFSCDVFRKNTAKLVKAVSEFAITGRIFNMQVSSICRIKIFY